MSIASRKYDEIMQEYADVRRSNAQLLLERKNRIYNEIPEYKQIDDEISELSVSQAKLLITTDADSASVLLALRKQISEMSERKLKLLTAAGYLADYLSPVFNCPDCRDTGYIDQERCHCLKKKIIEVFYSQSHIKSVLEKENFTSLTYKYYNESEKAQMEAYIKRARDFVDTFDSSFNNLLMFGKVGAGKTFLSNCIAKELLDQGHSVIYFTAYQLFELIAQITFNRDAAESSDINDILECDLLIIDDLGAERPNSFTISQFFLILNERLQRKRSVVISTNLDPSQLRDTYSERSISRILGNYTIMEFTGRDMRTLMRFS